MNFVDFQGPVTFFMATVDKMRMRLNKFYDQKVKHEHHGGLLEIHSCLARKACIDLKMTEHIKVYLY